MIEYVKVEKGVDNMRQFLVISLMLSVILVSSLAIAGGGPDVKYGKACSEKSLFQKMSDSIEETGHPEGEKEPAKVDTFRTAKKHIMSLDDSNKKAQGLSLRGNQKELRRRMGVPEDKM